MSSSPFLEIPNEQWIASNALAFAVLDGFPVSSGHTLVIAKRLVATWFEASAEEQAESLDSRVISQPRPKQITALESAGVKKV